MPLLVDSLLVELGLDSAKFKKGQTEAEGSFKKTKEEAAKFGKGIEDSGKKAADSIGRVATAALALFAVFTGARSLKDFVSNVTATDAALGRLAANMKATPQILSAFQGAIERNGGSAASAASGFASFSNSIQELKATGTTGILPFLLRLQAAGGKQIDLTKSLDEQFVTIADDLAAVAKHDRPLANWFGKQLGFDQDFVNLLLKGGPAVRQLLEDQKRLAPRSSDIDAAQKLLDSMVRLRQTTVSIGREIETALTPYIVDLVGKMREWLEVNRAWVETAIVDQVKAFAEWLKSINWAEIGTGMAEFVKSANEAAKAVGGWTKAAEILFGLWIGSKFLAMVANVRLLASLFGGPWVAAFLAAVGVGGYYGKKAVESELQAEPLTPQERQGYGLVGRWWKRNAPTWLGGESAGEARRRKSSAGKPNAQFTKENADALRSAAKDLGTSPENLAKVISYETGGTFSPSVWGGKGGNYMGLIQFGPSERKQFGANENQSFSEQVTGPVVRYLKARGFKPGMSLLDLYSTINAGSPGHYNASDGNGTVSSHVANIEASHGARAQAFLNSGGSSYAAGPTLGGVQVYRQADADILGLAKGAKGSASSVSNRTSMSTSTSQTSIGTIHVNTLATDANGIAKDLRPAIERNSFTMQANYGPT